MRVSGKEQLKVLFFFMLFLFIFPASSFAEKLLVIDPGHGGRYSGTCGYSGASTGFCEETANLQVGLKVRDALRNTDIKVVMTRDSDRDFSSASASADLIARMKVANAAVTNNNDNSLFVSIHSNASPSSPYVKGVETYYYDGYNHLQPDYPPDPIQMNYYSESKRLAETVHPTVISYLGAINRGIGNDQSFYVIRNAQMPAILIEMGYMTNRDEEALLKSAAYQQRVAQAIADSVTAFYKVFEVHDENGKIIKTFKTEQEAVNYANQLGTTVSVFDKDKQTYTYLNSKFEVYHRTNGLLKALPTEAAAIDYAEHWRNTRIVSMDTNRTVWSNYLDKKYDVYVNNQVSGSFYDYDSALAYSEGKANIKIVNNKTNDVLWTNIPGVAVTRDVTVSSLSGQTRFETAIKVSNELYPNGFAEDKQQKTVILATGYQFADALSAGPLSNYYEKAPILLTHATVLDEAVKQEISRLGATKVVIVGGQDAIAKTIEDTLVSMQLGVERISGATRYETNLNILQKIGNVNGLFVVYGRNFPDALTVAPIAANKNWGIMLVQEGNVTPSRSLNLNSKNVVIAGGTDAISEKVKQQLASVYPSSSIVRLAGVDRYATNAIINLNFEDSLRSNKVNLTTGKDFPDALASAPLSIGTGSPLVLIGDYLNRNVESQLLEFGSDNVVDQLEVIGGIVNNQLSQSVKNRLK
ncbi:N-acetylmuramoyl-L-alanine amidase [Neobacillus sp. OS1-2]|uniref:cell wall-binding repeat-containing protein n=1 Tax=Neobacillus sp. OS1-2 TaxID=3070680 RepID=UPI0027E1A9AC|nr:cell wall-binding repeat-containing protein [Neobacillus sp. OS1-2]WML41230.1 N-acetylmuramoyl-L-alanine amidase [Neobacillus sp. OS1-2]